MRHEPKTKATKSPDDVSLLAIARLATAQQNTLEFDADASIAELQALLLGYQTAFESISQGVCFFDGAGRLILSNRRYTEIYRLRPEDVRPGATLREIVERRITVGTCPLSVDDYLAKADAINSGSGPRIWAAALADSRVIQIGHQPMPGGGWVSTHEDITELQSRRAVASERISLQALIDGVPDHLWVKDLHGRFVVANKALATDNGRARTTDLIGLTDFDLRSQDAARSIQAIEEEILQTGQPAVGMEETVLNSAGATKWLSTSKVPLRNDGDEIFGLVGISRDITEHKQAADRIQFMASHDALTGLPNRTLLKDRLAQAILFADRYELGASVVFIDLDNFKLVNDSLGHLAGDELLKLVAARMVASVRTTDTVVRLGGDEFVILLPDQPKNAEMITAVLQNVRAAISEPAQIGGRELRVTGSLGIATYPSDGTDPETLLANADTAMYRAKETGRDNFQFYTPGLNARVHEKFALQEDLRGAISRAELLLLYQPQIDLRSNHLFAVEALLRWQHPRLGIIPPAVFIPIAEDSGLIISIGDWVLNEACRQNKAWQDAGLPPVSVCVNVSAKQFKDRSLVDRVVRALEEAGLDAKYLELELTESVIMQDVELALEIMNELRELGIQLAIDDFGTGYSSLSALKKFPVARLKIDKSFIDDLADSEEDRAVASAVISLGQKLNMRVIAEGVETDGQLTFLKENNCDEMQGYHFSRPVSAHDIAHILAG